MQIEISEALSNSLAAPINHAVNSANGAQFALMLSLAHEAQVGQKTGWRPESKPPESTVSTHSSIPLQMNHTLAVALQSGNGAAFNLVSALHGERQPAATLSGTPDEQKADHSPQIDRRGRQDPMLETIDTSKRYADRLTTV